MSATVSYKCEFEAGYVQNSQFHAHRYRVEVTVDGPERYKNQGQVIDYHVLAKFVKEICPDKCFLIGTDAVQEEIAVAECLKTCGVSINYRPHRLTIESFCESLACELQDLLNRHEPCVRVIEVRLRETADSAATWNL